MVPIHRVVVLAGAVAGVAATAQATSPPLRDPYRPGQLVSVNVDVDGRRMPLYPDPKGTGRLYLEAREGARYEIRLDNRTGERVGVAVTVDGLNVISGERSTGHGRMYVLDPWDSTQIRGWRSSLRDVRRFTFVDEKTSYAARTGQANGRMGWIEVSVFRELGRPRVCCDGPVRGTPYPHDRSRDDASGRGPAGAFEAPAERQAAPTEPRAEAPMPATPPPPDEAGPKSSGGAKRAPDGTLARRPAEAESRSFPGTGWGSRLDDPVVVVDFRPEPSPAEQLTLRYEYASALRALGIRVWPDTADRLRDRERGDGGFAKPPAQ